ncbi:hypothetical protein ACVWYN_000344 [Pedobacter sp. UYP24]
MKYLSLLLMLLLGSNISKSQELFVFSEPASNMPSKSIGIRLTNEGMTNKTFVSRTIPEVMIGFNKNLMTHAQVFFSDMDGGYKFEGGSVYAKYRFLTNDNLKRHFRASAFARISKSNRSTYTQDINLEGDNSGIQGGLVFTQLLHKLALSSSLGYAKSFGNGDKQLLNQDHPDQMLSYSLSSGYLLFPFVYKDYHQPNFNVYFELLGKTNPLNGRSYIDFAPAVQMVLNSKTRIDIGYRFEIAGDLENRYTRNMYLARVEFNLFNVLK